MKRRILPMIMAVMIILSIIQVPAWAATGDDPAGEDGNPGQVSEQPVEESAEPSAPVEEEEPASNETNSLPNGETEEEPAPEEQADNVAEVNGQGFPTLQAAINAAKDNVETTVKLIDNIVMSTSDIATIPEGKLIVLDMDGKSITVDCRFEGRPIVNDGVLTVTGNGIIDASDSESGLGAINNKGTLTVENGTYRGATYANGAAIRNTGTTAVLVIKDGTFEEATCAVFNEGTTTIEGGTFAGTTCSQCNSDIWGYTIRNYNANAKMTINGGTFTGVQGAVSASIGYLEINDGTFRSVKCTKNTSHTATFYALYAAGEVGKVKTVINGGTFETEGKVTAVLIGNDNTGGDGGINAEATAIINGGTFKAPEGVPALKGAEKTGDPIIYGGTFSSDVSEYLDPSCNMKQSGDNWVVTPLTKEDATASVGGKYYRSLSAAIAAAGDGDTVTLLEDTKEDIVIPKDAELTLDLNGRTLTNVSGHTITNNGTLTITGDGTVDNVTHGKAAIQNEPGGMVVLNGGAYTRSEENGNDDADSGGNSYYNIVNHGTMEINNGVSVTQTGHFSSMIENGWYRGSENTGGQNSVLTINGGTFSGGLNTIKNDDYGELTINDGTFTSMSQAAFLNWNIATVNGGTFNAESASSGVILNGYLDDSKDQGELTINGGTFNAGDSNTVITTMGGAKHSGDIEITGGTLSGSIVLTDSQDGAQMTITQDAKVSGNVTNSGKADVAITDGATVSGQVSNDTDGTMSVVNSTVGSVPEGTTAETIVIVNSTVDGELTTNTGDKAIMVGGKTYDTMAGAIEAVGNGQTIYVLKDIPDAVGIAVPSSKNFTIDFGGHTYTLIGPGAGSSGTETNGFQLLKDSTITLKNGTIRIAEGANNIKRIIQNYANLTLEDMHIYAQNQQPDENYALSFNNGDITFKGDTDVITSSDDVIAFDICKFSNYPSASVTFDESYTGTINGKIVYDSTDADTHTLTIQGNGTFGTIEAASGAGEAAKAGIEVTSGHFAKPVDKDYLAETVKAQLKSASNPEAPYSYYPSVENAIAAAKPGDTVTAVNTKPGKTTYTVTLKFNDGKTDNLTYEVSEGTAIDLPTPSRSGYTFEGWYDGNTRVSDPYNVTKTVTLTAGWDYKDDDHGSSSSGSSSSVRRYDIEADAGRGGDISPDGRVRVRRGENQTFRITADDGYEIYDVEVDGESVGAVSRYTFENVREDHTISATFRQTGAQTEEAQLPFLDVAEGAWYYDAVTYCYENGIMDGTSSVSFAPGMLLNRAMAAQVLYNLADGTASTAAGFPDVAASAWYADAVNWAAANGYVTGYDNGSFGPEDSLTREQLAVILYRYAGSPEPTGSLDGFTDAASASDYAVDALRWAVGEGLLTGKDGGRLDPAGTASRSELAQILARFAQI